ncbi:DotD/TraH family lipoprotein [Cysteiniphilum sp. JM-1]|uniref:DotD/TraH family lipoprotein n=1 Tax=Cysteiniphilum sp. JM-1 TaxID=2610891 RepID=UPI0012479368|nr:DotD/TraH family lipoprotein [Cysteiniphilum sp. JM-1]
MKSNIKISKTIQLIAMTGALVCLSGCSTIMSLPGVSYFKKKPEKANTGVTGQQLNETVLLQINQSAERISVSLSELNRVYAMAHKTTEMPFQDVDGNKLSKALEITWYGAVQPLLEKIAENVGYQFQVFGTESEFPVIVRVGDDRSPKKATAFEILQDIQLQSAKQVKIFINTDKKLVSMRYV